MPGNGEDPLSAVVEIVLLQELCPQQFRKGAVRINDEKMRRRTRKWIKIEVPMVLPSAPVYLPQTHPPKQ